MMRIAHLAYRYLPRIGGLEMYIDQLRDALRPLAAEQTVYQCANGVEEDGVVSLPAPRLIPLKLLDFDLALVRRGREFRRFDLVIVHNPEHFGPWIPARKGLVVSHGATWTHEGRGIRRALRSGAMAHAFRRAGAVVANDSFVLREMGHDVAPGTCFGEEVAPGRWFVPNAIDTRVFAPGAATAPGGATARGGVAAAVSGAIRPEIDALVGPLVLVPRNLSRSRGIDLAVQAFATSRVLPPDAHLVVTGQAIPDVPASVAYAAELAALAHELGVAERVHFLGGLSREEMRRLYLRAALTLVPTRYSEGTSLAALESMATECATLCSAVEGLLDLPGPHTPPEAGAFRERIDEVWENRATLGREQRERVRRDFDTSLWAERWRRAVTAAVESARGRRRSQAS